MKIKDNSHDRLFFWGALLTALLIAAIFGVVTAQIWNHSDYVPHVSWSGDMARTGYMNLPHTAYQQFSLIIRAFIPFTLLRVFGSPFTDIFPTYSFQIAGFLTAILFYVGLALLIFDRVKKENPNLPPGVLLSLCLGTPILLELLAPINIFTLLSRDLYIGYIGINVFHNPTIVILKPISLLLFWIVLDRMRIVNGHTDQRKTTFGFMAGLALLTVVNLITKPNFILCFLPALWLVALIRIWQKEKIAWWLIIAGITIPSILVLVLQYLFTFSIDQTSGIAFAPMQTMWNFNISTLGAIFRLILSCLFPIVMLFLFFKEIIRNNRLLIAYVTFIFALLFAYLLVETGPRSLHGNFLWGAEVALFILCVELVLLFIRKYATIFKQSYKDWRFWLSSSTLLLHFLCGIAWYFAEVLRPHQWWGMMLNL